MNIQLADTASHELLQDLPLSWTARSGELGQPIQFGRFLAAPCARRLFADGRQVEIGSRAFDLLIALLRARGAIVSKSELMSHAWPSTAVDESNLRFQMGTLRKALGQDRNIIKTIPGRGYMLAIETPSTMPEDVALPWVTRSKRPGEAAGTERVPDRAAESEPASQREDEANSNIGDALRGIFGPAETGLEATATIQGPVFGMRFQLMDQHGPNILIQLAKSNAPVSVILIGDFAGAAMLMRAIIGESVTGRENEATMVRGRCDIGDPASDLQGFAAP